MSIDTVVFDIGNVLLHWDRRNLYRKLIPDAAEMEQFLTEVCNTAWHEAQDAGRDGGEATAALIAQFPEHSELIAAFYGRFDEMIGGEVAGMEQILMALKARRVPIYGLSNWSADTFHHAERYGIISHLDGIVVSGREGVKKPNARLFQILFARYDINPSHALFVDDVAENVAAGMALGMTGHMFENAVRLRTVLKGYHLLAS